MNAKIKEQIIEIRDTGITNMFDSKYVQKLAFERDYFELVTFIEEHCDDYIHFILYGENQLESQCERKERLK